MLPASDLADILANLSTLNLQPTTAAQILAAAHVDAPSELLTQR
jgi:hypothetical protein